MATKDPSAFTSAYESPDDLLGSSVGDHLVLRSVLGVGSFAVVYEATSSRTPSTTYAVKALFKAGLTQEDLAIQAREGQLMRKLVHENIVHLYDIIDTPDCTFLVLEQCETDLYDLIETRRLSPDEGKFFFDRICAGVQHSHELGIYHRDLKPENILLTYEGDVKLTDFGLATTDRTSSDIGVGSVRYMSPACFDGERYDSVGNDIWALGIILMNLIIGQSPWVEPSVARDYLYAQYVSHGVRSFRSRFGITEEFAHVLELIFDRRVGIEEMKTLVAGVETFFVTQRDERVVPDVVARPVAATDEEAEMSFLVTGFNWADDEDADSGVPFLSTADEEETSDIIDASSVSATDLEDAHSLEQPVDVSVFNDKNLVPWLHESQAANTIPSSTTPDVKPYYALSDPPPYIDTGQTIKPTTPPSYSPEHQPLSHLILPSTIDATDPHSTRSTRPAPTFTHLLTRRLKLVSAAATRLTASLQCFFGTVGQKMAAVNPSYQVCANT
ncbi:kinase-like domain-containing protein [Fimicolochytrium jonesii]|uniref:kinase-like domain-containing protein n=1 Tax=Fimicolochytrium jonesii TaxID=1396493 RepID=UPI0022FE2081|nr:kinase-like domain-containing protein [Fimicolochytrium jonesii]KAI8818016.1 kinase-like domain-containing protein [Fimicolochytrium jonesii]